MSMTTVRDSRFGPLLLNYRTAVGLTQEELAERAGISVRSISDLERGIKTRPRSYTVRQLADALKLSPADRARFLGASRQERIQPLDVLPPNEPTRPVSESPRSVE